MSVIQASRATARHAMGEPPELRSTIVTLFGSAARWLTLTWKSAAFAPGSEPGPDAPPDGLRTVPPIAVPVAPFLPSPREADESMLDDARGTGGVLTETVSPPPPCVFIGSCDGIESMSCGE